MGSHSSIAALYPKGSPPSLKLARPVTAHYSTTQEADSVFETSKAPTQTIS